MPEPQKDGSVRWTVAEMWPEHADHDVRYQRDIFETFRLRTMDTEIAFDRPMITFVQFDEAPVVSCPGDTRSDEYWCATCNEELYEPDNIPIVPIPGGTHDTNGDHRP